MLSFGPQLAHAEDSGWVRQSEQPVLDSSLSDENTNARPSQTNLCEGTTGIPFGGDPPWVRVGGSPDPNTPFVEARGQVLPDSAQAPFFNKTNPFVTHTDAFFDHYTKDINAFVTLDKPYRGLLGTGNFATGEENEHAQLEVEWERGGVPKFAFPSAGERIVIWGSHIWDCGHDENDEGDTTGHRSEIHPPVGWVHYRNTANTVDLHGSPPDAKRLQDPWIWYEATDRQGIGATLPSTGLLDTPVQSTVADAFFSTWGGQTMESLNGCDDQTVVNSGTVDAPCTLPFGAKWFQPVLNQDYTFFVPAPPRPSADAVLIYGSEDRCSEVPANPANPSEDHPGPGFPVERMFGDIEDVGPADDSSANIGAATCGTIPDAIVLATENGQPGIRVTVRARTGGATYPANHYLAFAKRYKVAWDFVPAAAQQVHSYRVDLNHVRVYDDADPCGEDGEWVMSIQVNEKWIYPVRGHGDDDDPFWRSGALDDDKCIPLHDPTFKEYGIGESLTVSVVPGQQLRVRERSYDIDFFANDVLPVVDSLPGGPGTYEVGDTNTDHEGAHTIGFTVTDVTDALPATGQLTIGNPKYGPNADTGNVTRVNGTAAHKTPITFTLPGGTNGFEYRVWRDGTPIPTAWNVDLDGSDGFAVNLPAAETDSGSYVIEWATIKDYAGRKIVSPRTRMTVQLDNTAPLLTVPADFEVLATQTGGAIVTYTVNATDNFPGPVTTTCSPASGSLFPNGKNAPLATTVTCTATDAVENETVHTFKVTVKSPFGYVPDFVALGQDWVQLGASVIVERGNIGALASSAGVPNVGLSGMEAVIGTSSTLRNGGQVAAQSVMLGALAQLGEVFSVDQLSAASGAVYVPKTGYIPLFSGMPAAPSIATGGDTLSILNAQTLPAGTYGRLSVGSNGVLNLTGGTYGFMSVEVKPGGRIAFSAPVTIGVAETVQMGNRASFAPAEGSGVQARQGVVYALGADGPPNTPASAIDIGSQARVALNAYAVNGTLAIGAFSDATGAYLGRRVNVASNVTLRLDSSFLAP